MFANLKKKIQETESESRRGLASGSHSPLGKKGTEGSPIKASVLDGQQSSLIKQPLSKTGSKRNIDGIHTAQSQSTSENTSPEKSELTEDLLHQYKNAAQVEILKAKVLELNSQLEIQNENIINQNFRAADDHKEILKKKEKEWSEKYKILETEKKDLEEKLLQSKSQVDKLIARQENTEEVESFQNQEMAKIKHLLLKSQQEVRRQEELFKKKCDELHAVNQKLLDSDSHISSLTQQLESAKQRLSEVNMLHEEKKQLIGEVDHLKQEALKTNLILDEKDAHISFLEGRINLLEKRLDNSALTGDDRIQSLISERDALEKRLEESRQHLTDIKTTWSEKINSLETQIFHLNKKMAEDSEECSDLESKVADLTQQLHIKEEENWKLYDRLQESDQALSQLKSTSASNVEKMRQQCEEYNAEIQDKIVLLESTLKDNITNWEKEKKDMQARINELEAVQTECLEKEIEMEKSNSALEDECRKLRGMFNEKEKECECLTATTASMKLAQSEIENKAVQLEHDKEEKENVLTTLQSNLKDRDAELQAASQERDNLLMRNAELSHQLELLRREMNEEHKSHEREREETEQQVQNLMGELHLAQDKVQEIKIQTNESIENSSTYLGLKATIANLESQLAEKNKTLRLQQQRLGDMKKALHRELRSQSGVDGLQILDGADSAAPQQTDARSIANFIQGKDFSSKNLSFSNHVYDEDINFKYLKHVVFKFMTSREYEAQHLIRAVSVLLHFTPEEESIIRETLERKMSWFGSRPVFKSHTSHAYVAS